MRDFLDDLERRLEAAAEQHPELQSPPLRRRRRGRRPVALGGLTALIAAAAAAFTMTGTSLAELPILRTPTQDASNLKQRADGAANAGVDFAKAHVFNTPGGPGYALLNERTQTLCLVVPDPGAPGDYGNSCDAPLSAVERRGLKAEFPGDTAQDPDAITLLVFVLPEGADDVHLADPPRGATLTVDSGVAVIQTPSETHLRWTVDESSGELLVEGPFRTTSFGFTCPDGTEQSVPAPPSTDRTAEEIRQAVKIARKQACG